MPRTRSFTRPLRPISEKGREEEEARTRKIVCLSARAANSALIGPFFLLLSRESPEAKSSYFSLEGRRISLQPDQHGMSEILLGSCES